MREAGEYGSWDPRFRAVADRFAEFIAADPSFSAQLSVVLDGEPVVDLAAGPAVRSSSVTGVYSSTKGVAALVIAHLIDIGRIDPDHRVADYWPQFSEAGKGQITVRQLAVAPGRASRRGETTHARRRRRLACGGGDARGTAATVASGVRVRLSRADDRHPDGGARPACGGSNPPGGLRDCRPRPDRRRLPPRPSRE